MTQRELAEHVGIEGPTLVRLLDALAARGLIERLPVEGDRRAKHIRLQVGAAVWFLGQTIYAQANILAYRDGFLITAVVFAAALVPTWLLDRARR